MLQFNFILGLIFIFFCIKLITIPTNKRNQGLNLTTTYIILTWRSCRSYWSAERWRIEVRLPLGPGQVSASPHPRWGVFVQDGLQLSRLMRNEKCTVLFIALVFFTAEKLRKNKQTNQLYINTSLGIDTARKCQGKKRKEIFTMLKKTYMVVVCMFRGEGISTSKVT